VSHIVTEFLFSDETLQEFNMSVNPGAKRTGKLKGKEGAASGSSESGQTDMPGGPFGTTPFFPSSWNWTLPPTVGTPSCFSPSGQIMMMMPPGHGDLSSLSPHISAAVPISNNSNRSQAASSNTMMRPYWLPQSDFYFSSRDPQTQSTLPYGIGAFSSGHAGLQQTLQGLYSHRGEYDHGLLHRQNPAATGGTVDCLPQNLDNINLAKSEQVYEAVNAEEPASRSMAYGNRRSATGSRLVHQHHETGYQRYATSLPAGALCAPAFPYANASEERGAAHVGLVSISGNMFPATSHDRVCRNVGLPPSQDVQVMQRDGSSMTEADVQAGANTAHSLVMKSGRDASGSNSGVLMPDICPQPSRYPAPTRMGGSEVENVSKDFGAAGADQAPAAKASTQPHDGDLSAQLTHDAAQRPELQQFRDGGDARSSGGVGMYINSRHSAGGAHQGNYPAGLGHQTSGRSTINQFTDFPETAEGAMRAYASVGSMEPLLGSAMGMGMGGVGMCTGTAMGMGGVSIGAHHHLPNTSSAFRPELQYSLMAEPALSMSSTARAQDAGDKEETDQRTPSAKPPKVFGPFEVFP
jgi:hypothetical protein